MKHGLKIFFKKAVVSSTQIRKIIQQAADKNNVTGFEHNDRTVTHSLRGMATQLMVEAGFADSSISKCTGHRCLDSIRDYYNLRGTTGELQQNVLLPSTGSTSIQEASDSISFPKRFKPNKDSRDNSKNLHERSFDPSDDVVSKSDILRDVESAIGTINANGPVTINININKN